MTNFFKREVGGASEAAGQDGVGTCLCCYERNAVSVLSHNHAKTPEPTRLPFCIKKGSFMYELNTFHISIVNLSI